MALADLHQAQLALRNQAVLRRAQDYRATVEDAGVKNTTVFGRILIPGAGEATVTVPFPVVFSERPCFTYGWEYDTDYVPVTGAGAGGWAAVRRWTHPEYDPGRSLYAVAQYFNGADIYVHVLGDPKQQVWLHWKMEGRALRNPTLPSSAASTDLDEVL